MAESKSTALPLGYAPICAVMRKRRMPTMIAYINKGRQGRNPPNRCREAHACIVETIRSKLRSNGLAERGPCEYGPARFGV